MEQLILFSDFARGCWAAEMNGWSVEAKDIRSPQEAPE
jgi:hypothetical protein